MRRRWILLASVMVCLSLMVYGFSTRLNSFADEDDQALLLIIKQGSKMAAESITSGKGRVTVQDLETKPGGEVLEIEHKYNVVFSSKKFRYHVESKYLRNEIPSEEGSGRQPIQPGEVLIRDASYNGETTTSYDKHRDAWEIGDKLTESGHIVIGHYKHYISPTNLSYADLSTLDTTEGVTISKELQVVGHEIISGDECVVLEFAYEMTSKSGEKHSTWRRYWVNPAKGYGISKARFWGQGGPGYEEKTLLTEVNVEFRQYGAGLWGPAKVVHEEFRVNPETHVWWTNSKIVVVYDNDFELNIPVDNEELTLPIPSGVHVRNELTGRGDIQP